MTRTFLIRVALGATVALGAWGCEDDEGTKPTDGPSDSRPADGGTDTASTETGGTEAGTEAGAKDTGGGDAGDAGDAGPALTALQARGKYLVDVVIACPECHTPRNAMGMFLPGKYLSGDNAMNSPAPNCLFANMARTECIYPRNLTNDETGLKNRTDAEIKKMFMEGKRPAATAGGMEEALHPVMPYYVLKNMTDADADAIVAYLRTVPPVVNMVPRRGASFDIPAPVPAINMANVPMPSAGYADVAAATRGRYLATQTGLCIECHTKRLAPPSATVLDETKFFQGGEDFTGALGPTIMIHSKNLTPDMMTGLGSWTIAQIVAVLKEGKDKDGKGICPPMPAGKLGETMMAGYGNLTDQDANDIAHYLKSIPAATNMVQDMCTFMPGM
jgi:mono/diheme cytochrome c family protein